MNEGDKAISKSDPSLYTVSVATPQNKPKLGERGRKAEGKERQPLPSRVTGEMGKGRYVSLKLLQKSCRPVFCSWKVVTAGSGAAWGSKLHRDSSLISTLLSTDGREGLPTATQLKRPPGLQVRHSGSYPKYFPPWLASEKNKGKQQETSKRGGRQ